MAECEPAVDHTETIRIRPCFEFEDQKFLYACPAMWTVRTKEDYGPRVKNVRAMREQDKYCLFRECRDCKVHTSPDYAATYKDAHFYKLKYCTHTRQDRPVDLKKAMRRRAFLIRPLPHGNGGIAGFEVMQEFKTLRQGLKSKPYWRQECSPYSATEILNNPRLCSSKDYSDCLYIFDLDTREWQKAEADE